MAQEQIKEEEKVTSADEAATQEQTTATEAKPKKKKARRAVAQGQVHVLATFNNTIVTVTDTKGNVLTNSSAGSSGFRGSKKGTAYAAQIAAERAITQAKQTYGTTKVEVFVKGVGLGREAAIRTLASQNVEVEGVKDVTGIPHGGARPRKAKRN